MKCRARRWCLSARSTDRNIWKSDPNALLEWLEPLHQQLGDRFWIVLSCSLLHVPIDLNTEVLLDAEIKSRLAFALRKLEELEVLAGALNHGRESVADELGANAAAIGKRHRSPRVNRSSTTSSLTPK